MGKHTCVYEPAPSPRDELAWFASQMEAKLRENDDRDGWENCEPGWLLRRLGQELGELRRAMLRNKDALGAKTAEEVIREAADVANFAMMIADVARASAIEDEELSEPRQP